MTSSSSTAWWCSGWLWAEALRSARLGFGEKPRLRARWLLCGIRRKRSGDDGKSVRLAHLSRGLRLGRATRRLVPHLRSCSRSPSATSRIFWCCFWRFRQATALGWQRRFRVFEFGLLIFAASVSFRSQRDLWVDHCCRSLHPGVVDCRQSKLTQSASPEWLPAVAVLMAALAALSGFRLMHVTSALLEGQVINYLPERAVNEIKAKRGYPGPAL